MIRSEKAGRVAPPLQAEHCSLCSPQLPKPHLKGASAKSLPHPNSHRTQESPRRGTVSTEVGGWGYEVVSICDCVGACL